MKRILLSGLLLGSVCASAQILVNESFENSALPSGFSSFANAAHSTTRNPLYGTRAGTPCDGAKTAYLNLYGPSFASGWYFVYSSQLSNGQDLNYSFDYLAKKFGSSSTVNGTLSVEYSSDGGTTWTVSTPDITLTDDIACTTVTGTIPAADIPVGADFKIRIISKKIGSADYYMGIDSFSLQQVVTSPPSCTNITYPTNGQVVNTVTPMIFYDSSVGAMGYKISIGTTPGGTDIIDNMNNGSSLNYYVPSSANLQYGTEYYVTVVPTNTIGDATGCTSVQFNTGTQLSFNDECATAINVSSFPYINVQANANQSTNNGGFINICSDGINDGLWYKFVGDGSSHTINITNVQSDFDVEVQVYSGSCGAFTCVARKDLGYAGADETVTFQTTAGTEYFVNVGNYDNDVDNPEGDFTIHITREQLSTSEVNTKVKGITIAPNPFVDVVRFDGVDVKSVVATDVTGRKVAELPVEGNVANLGGLTPGMYVLVLKHKDGSTSSVKAIKK
ncbi:hypothetical protein [Bergeyella zoohelcum]|uniref:Por secretion system C-terminal sorting domain n=1 Tax=Bergeyella zoohelcum TaxID=1015 RepID=A0A380ZUE1_9FLAO|nr:hypothetical protein [Bergeyella zoohelcum]EKB60348.1 hypothetical protein HMPREF9700_01167 [Bergeyella zoohelcum CCUG 30536]SUV52971.1 Uncharacterised protein [Bergeyella zoohelcum]